MCIMHRTLLMAIRHRWLEMTTCFGGGSSVHLYPADCYLEIPSTKGIKPKLMVTTSNHVWGNMADLGDDLEIERDELAANDLMRTATRLVVRVTRLLEHRHRRRVMLILRPRSADVEELTTNQDHRERIIHLRSFS